MVLNAFGVVVNALGTRVKPYLPQICGTILWRLNNKAAKVRQQAADLISRIANVMMQCGEVSCIAAVGACVLACDGHLGSIPFSIMPVACAIPQLALL